MQAIGIHQDGGTLCIGWRGLVTKMIPSSVTVTKMANIQLKIAAALNLNRNVLAIINLRSDNVNDHRAAAKIIVFKSHAARGSVCNVLSFRVLRIVVRWVSE